MLLSRVSSPTECLQRWPKQSTFQRPQDLDLCSCKSCWGKWKRSCRWPSSRYGAKIRKRHCRTQISRCRFGESGFQRLYKTGSSGPRCRCRWRRSSLAARLGSVPPLLLPHNNWCHWHNRLLSRVSSSIECLQRWPKQSTFQRPKCRSTCRSCWGKWKRSCCWASSRSGAKIQKRHCQIQILRCRFGESGFQRLYKTGWLGPRCRCRWRRSSLAAWLPLLGIGQCTSSLAWSRTPHHHHHIVHIVCCHHHRSSSSRRRNRPCKSQVDHRDVPQGNNLQTFE